MRGNDSFNFRPAIPAAILVATALVATALLLWLVVGTAFASPVDADHAVGTLVRVDVASKRLALATDAQTGSELGQGSEMNVYVDATTTATRDGKRVPLADLKPGERLLVRTQTTRNRTLASKILVLPDTNMEQGPQRYLHGTVGEVRTGTQTLHINQSETLILNRIGYDEQTTVVTLDGKTVPVTSLKPGDEIDTALHLRGKITTATKMVLLRPAKAP